MKIPETYEEYLKTPDEILKKIACSEKTKEETERLVSFAMRAIEEFKDKDKLISEEKRKSAKSNWERNVKYMMNGLDEQTKGAIIDHQNDADYWMEYRQGNILNEFDLDYIVHQCNCFHCMGGGVAYALSKTWPKVYEVDNETEYASKDKMGTYSVAKINRPVALNDEIVEHELNVINIYSQYEPGMAASNEEIEFSKECLKKAFLQLREDIITRAESCIIENRKYLVGIPWMIGCGIYGMNVNEIFELIRDIFNDYSHVIRIVFVDYN